jgi:hypothetical protein
MALSPETWHHGSGAGRGNRRRRKEEGMHVGDVDLHPSPPGVDTGQEKFRGFTFGARFFLVVTIAVIFAVVVLPLLLWTAGILAGG